MRQAGEGASGRKSGVNRARRALLLAAAAVLAACAPTIEAERPQTAALPASEHLGSGKVKVALLLPLTGAGDLPVLAAGLRNAAALALKETPGADLDVIIEDDKGTAEGARAATIAALDAGAELVIGPLLAESVRGAAGVARPAGIPILAFSSDATVAARGVYVLGFLPESDAQRIASFAVARGKRRMAALVPDTGYGAVFSAALQRAAGAAGGGVATIERYAADPASMAARVAAVTALAGQGTVDTIAAPSADPATLRLGGAVGSAGLGGRVQLLGSGLWDNPRILGAPGLEGGWYPAPEKGGFDSFAARYRSAYGLAPPRVAALAFDATRLAAGLAARYGERRYLFDTLTNPVGFSGVDGAFRLRPDGLNQRALAIYEIAGGSPRLIDPAPKSFPPG